ncbi:DNA (cytosine-5)-methyltransferase CMT1-like protein, partial [Drosera capensis]
MIQMYCMMYFTITTPYHSIKTIMRGHAKFQRKRELVSETLPGVRVGPDNKVELDPTVERVLLTSQKPLVPNYAISFVNGTSSKPFGRLWYDETVPTVVTRAEPHNQ